MKGQQQMMDFMMTNPPPQFEYNMQVQELPIYLSEFERGFNDWSDMIEVRLDYIENKLEGPERQEFDQFENEMEFQLESINMDYDDLFKQIDELVRDNQSEQVIFEFLVDQMNTID